MSLSDSLRDDISYHIILLLNEILSLTSQYWYRILKNNELHCRCVLSCMHDRVLHCIRLEHERKLCSQSVEHLDWLFHHVHFLLCTLYLKINHFKKHVLLHNTFNCMHWNTKSTTFFFTQWLQQLLQTGSALIVLSLCL